MANISNPLSNLSYTNKDFQTIYPELLDLVKKLSYKWDPSISDESDPGVVLIKLNALIADKCNYNIDKNILEAFPESVTQESNARHLFEQLGYRMHWYKGATTSITFSWIGSLEDTDYTTDTIITIPAFTMVTDSESSIVYTTIEDANLTMDPSTPVTVQAIQGTAVRYTIDGTDLIKISNLDSNNRLYLDGYNIAENGIFIWNDNAYVQAYEDWKAVDNLAVQPIATKCYEFGITRDESTCYIEFPEDIDLLFESGIHIEYIRTNGSEGVISARVLEKFLQDVVIADPVDNTKTLSLTSENIKIRNNSAANNGFDPETISEAYKAYQKTIGTFNTLVTLRDYMNAINTSDIICNSVVTDRTTDPQSSYYIISDTGKTSALKLHEVIDSHTDKKELTAFDLRLYLLQYSDYTNIIIPTNSTQYNSSFDLVLPNSSKYKMMSNTAKQGYLDSKKSLQHDFSPFIGSYIPDDPTESADIRPCLFKNKYQLNARIIPYYQLTETQIKNILENIQLALYKNLYSRQIDFGDEISYDVVFDIISNADERIKSIALDDITYDTYAVYVTKEYNSGYDEWEYTAYETKISLDDLTRMSTSEVFLTDDEVASITDPQEKLIKQTIRTDIFSKSVLAGKTQLLTPENDFIYSLNQSKLGIFSDIQKVSSEFQLTLSNQDSSYTIGENENIQIFKPSLIKDLSYGYSVKYACNLTFSIPANSDYTLQANDWILFFWKAESTDTSYKFRIYQENDIITPTFAMPSRVGEILDSNIKAAMSGPSGLVSGSVDENTEVSTGTKIVTLKNVVDEEHVFSASQEVTIKNQNQVILDKPYNFYWVMNTIENINGIDQYVLFEASESSYILGPNEYIFYTDDLKQDLAILGPGTYITRAVSTDTWSVPVKDLDTLLEYGIEAFTDDDWKRIDCSQNNITIDEMSITNLGAGVTIILNDLVTDYTIQAEPAVLADNATISYINTDGSRVDLPAFSSPRFSNYILRSVFNINISKSKPQLLSKADVGSGKVTRSLVFTDLSDNAITVSASSVDDIYIQANYPLAFTGGDNISAQLLRLDGTYAYPSIYWYTAATLEKNSVEEPLDMTRNDIVLTGELTSSSTLPAQVTYFTITFDIPVGKYIIPVYSTCPLGLAILDDNDDPLYRFNTDESTADLTRVMLYFVNLDITQDAPVTLKFNITSKNVTTSVDIYQLFSYTNTYSQDLIDTVLSRIKTLDPDLLFNYTYEVSDTVNIVNPLNAKSFLNTEHIFNGNTICQLDTASLTDIKVVNKVKAQG